MFQKAVVLKLYLQKTYKHAYYGNWVLNNWLRP